MFGAQRRDDSGWHAFQNVHLGGHFTGCIVPQLYRKFGLEFIFDINSNTCRFVDHQSGLMNGGQAVYKWYRRQSSDSDTAIPYLCAIIGSLLWLRYSIFINDVKLVLLQAYAVLMQTFFLLAMLFYRSKKRRLCRIILAIFLSIAILFLFISQLPTEMGLQFTGICASGAQILGSFVCPYLIYKAISTKYIDFVPFAPVAFTWVMELHAIIYSVGINDIYLLTANSVFFTMDGLLLSMFFIYPTERKANKEPKIVKVNML